MNQPSRSLRPRRRWLGESAVPLLVLFLVVPVVAWTAFLNAWTLAPAWQVVIGVVLVMGLMALGILYRRLLFSPVLLFELVRLARSRRIIIGRCTFGLVILIVLFLAYAARFGMHDWHFLGSAQKLSRAEKAQFASQFFYAFLAVQLLAVVLLLPLRTASAIAGEKEKRCLEFILTTELSSTEIVLGKLLAVLAGMGLLLLTGLPVLGFVQLLGGVEPRLLVAGFLVTLATMVSLGSMGMLVSVYNRTSWGAAFRTYLWALLSGVSVSPVVTLIALEELQRRKTLSSFFGVLAIYTVFHCLMGGVCCFLAIARFRWLALRHTSEQPHSGPQAKTPRRRPPRRPPVEDNPLLWKEMQETDSRALLKGFWAITPLIALIMLAIVVSNASGVGYARITEQDMTKDKIRAVATCWECLAFFILAMTTARRFSLEMEQRTLDSLLVLPQRQDVFLMKWVASMIYLRWQFAFACLAGIVGILVGWLDIRGFDCLLAAWLIYPAFLTHLALWLSLATGSTLRARMWTILTLFIVMGGIYLVADGASGLLRNRTAAKVAASVRDNGALPPITLWQLAFSEEEVRVPGLITCGEGGRLALARMEREEKEKIMVKIAGPLIGLAIYALLACLFWAMARQRFRGLVR